MCLVVGGMGAVIEVSPKSQSTCCGVAKYNIHISNTRRAQEAFVLSAEALNEGVNVVLEPKTILIPSMQSDDLVMLVRPRCEGGEYRIRVTVMCRDGCKGECKEGMGICYEGIVSVEVPEECGVPERAGEQEEGSNVTRGGEEGQESSNATGERIENKNTNETEEGNNKSGEETATGGATAGIGKDGIIAMLLSALVVAAIVIISLVFKLSHIQGDQKRVERKKGKK